MKIEKKAIAEINRAAYNPRVELQPGDRAYEKLKRSIEEFGYVEPIIINKVTGNVVGGHQRLTVLEDIGVTEVDCVIIEVDEVKEKQLNLALNKVSGEWDRDKLKDLFLDLEIEDDIDLSLTGFDDFEIDNIKLEFDHIEDLIDDDFISTEKEGVQENFAVSFVFPIEFKENLFDYIKENGKETIVKYIMDKVEGVGE